MTKQMAGNGKIIVITGPMYSGKSSTLVRYIDRSIAIGQRALLLSPILDTRADHQLVCHSGQRRDVIMNKYVRGDTTVADKSKDEKAKVSEVKGGGS